MEPNTNKYTGFIGLIVVVLLIVIAAGAYLYYDRAEAPALDQVNEGVETTFATKCGLTVESPKIGEEVSFPLTVSGKIDNTNSEETGCSWVMFEGQAGRAELQYETKDGWSLPVDDAFINVTNWMSATGTFSVVLNYDNSTLQLPSGYNFRVVLTEEDPSGKQPDVVEIPLVLR